jgi:hypothetical protein
MSEQILRELERRLEPVGLNLIGVADVRAYDAAVPEEASQRRRWPRARSAIVVGSGGPAYWRASRAFAAAHDDERHPLDGFAEHCFETLALDLLRPLRPEALYPHRFTSQPVSFVHLAACAGLGVRSLLGILIRPDYGTWFALRAAALVEVEIEPSRPLEFDPCPSCAKPCIAACPGTAVTTAGWNVPACTDHRKSERDCGDGCYSRLACVFGQEHRYPLEEIRHHQGYALRAMTLGAGEEGSGGWGLGAGEERIGLAPSPQPPAPASSRHTASAVARTGGGSRPR